MKRKLLISVTLLCAVGIFAIVFTALSRDTIHRRECDIYFLNDSESTIVSEKHTVKYHDDHDLKVAVIEDLISGPDNNKNRPVIDRRTKITSLEEVNPNEIVIDFNYKFLTTDPAKNVLSAYAVVKTLCTLDGIERVKVTVEKNDIPTPEGNPIGFLADEDINLSTDTNTSENREVTLYFADAENTKLVPETRNIMVTDQQPLAQYVINELIHGANSEDNANVLSPDTILIGVNITDNICFVNMQSNFITKNTGTKSKELLAIYSIVNSLTEFETIGRVRFLVNGKKVEYFGSTPLDMLFERNVDIIDFSPQQSPETVINQD